MISVIYHTGRFLFTALFFYHKQLFKKVSSLDTSFFFKKELLTKETKLVLY